MMTLKLCQGLTWSSQERELLVIEISFSVTCGSSPQAHLSSQETAGIPPTKAHIIPCLLLGVLVTPEARLSSQAFSCADARFQR